MIKKNKNKIKSLKYFQIYQYNQDHNQSKKNNRNLEKLVKNKIHFNKNYNYQLFNKRNKN